MLSSAISSILKFILALNGANNPQTAHLWKILPYAHMLKRLISNNLLYFQNIILKLIWVHATIKHIFRN